jgi:membrane protein YdbS with pleckstrin-like domain
MEDNRLDRIERKINRIGTLAVWTAGLIICSIAIALFVWFGSVSDSIVDVEAAAIIVVVVAGGLWYYWRPFRS